VKGCWCTNGDGGVYKIGPQLDQLDQAFHIDRPPLFDKREKFVTSPLCWRMDKETATSL
jgi:hypothetical protein